MRMKGQVGMLSGEHVCSGWWQSRGLMVPGLRSLPYQMPLSSPHSCPGSAEKDKNFLTLLLYRCQVESSERGEDTTGHLPRTGE